MLERTADWALGLTALGWALRDVVHGQWRVPVGLTLIVVNAVVGVLFVARRSAADRARVGESVWCLISVASSGLALRLAPAGEHWPLGPTVLFVLGGCVATVAAVTLGPRFGVLPAWRGLAMAGLYRLIRHPMYAAELLMVLGCCLAGRSWAGLAAAVLASGLVVVRIRLEERLLLEQAEYRDYARRVRSRLLPGLW